MGKRDLSSTDEMPDGKDRAQTSADVQHEQVDDKRSDKKIPTKHKKKKNLWAVKITIISLFLSAFISFLSELTTTADIIVTVLLLLFLVMASILFDGIGVAATSCDITPFISMASKKVYGAKTAMWLLKNNEKVSNVCNDLIGDIFGIISGSCSAAVVIRLLTIIDVRWQQLLTIALSSVVAALTIGGKAFLKNVAINNSREFVFFVSRILAVFNKEERKRRKKQKDDKKKYEQQDGVKNQPTKSENVNQKSLKDKDKNVKIIAPNAVKQDKNGENIDAPR